MRKVLLLLALLSAHSAQVQPLPYQADANGNCQDRDFLVEGSTLCCRMCPPGQRLKHKCLGSRDTECEPCAPQLYRKTWNYADTCQACTKCNARKGLLAAQSCNATANSRCECKPGMFCTMMLTNSHSCNDCRRHTVCRAGHGVSVPGSATSDVQCRKCAAGTFSNTSSSTEVCRPHTSCPLGQVNRGGTPTSDAECQPVSNRPPTAAGQSEPTSDSSVTSATSTTVTSAPSHKTAKSGSAFPTYFTTNEPDSVGVLVVPAVIGGILILLITIIVSVVCYKQRRDAAKYNPKVDANGNCECADEQASGSFLGETQLTSLKVTAAEQRCLLQSGGGSSSEHSQSSSGNSDSLTRTEGCSSHETIGPLHSTVAFDRAPSAGSEPTSLHSVVEAAAPQPGPPAPPTSPRVLSPVTTSPPVLSPVTTSPHVNVSITFNIGNGTCAAVAAPALPADSMQSDSVQSDPHLPFGEEEECVSVPQQEAGKQLLVSVEESDSYAAC